MISAWRIVKTKFAGNAFDGEGARLYGGMWNSPGRPVVYVAGSRALALLEVLVHLKNSALLTSYSFCSVGFDAKMVTRIDRAKLPADWRRYPAPAALQNLGDNWLEAPVSAALEVPSVIVPEESNYLINPLHGDFAGIQIDRPTPFTMDARLLDG